MAVCTDLDRKMQSMEEEIMVNPQYVKKSCGAPDDDLPPAPSQGSKIATYSMWSLEVQSAYFPGKVKNPNNLIFCSTVLCTW